MPRTEKTTRDPHYYVTISVSRETHSLVRKFLEDQDEGRDIGKFYSKAALEKMAKEKTKTK